MRYLQKAMFVHHRVTEETGKTGEGTLPVNAMLFTAELTENTEKGESQTGRKRACHCEAKDRAEAIPVYVKAAKGGFFQG